MPEAFAHPVQRSADRAGRQPSMIAPTRTMATAVIVAAGAFTAVSVGVAISAFGAQATIEAVLAGAPAPDVMAYDLFGVAYSVMAVVAWIVTAVWLSRARANSERISTLRHERGALWCWLGWIVPVVSFWFPRQVIRDVHRASTADLTAPRGLNLWWGLWVAGLAASQAADRFSLGGNYDNVSWLGPLNAISTLLLVGAFVAWVRIVTDVVRLQEAAVARTA